MQTSLLFSGSPDHSESVLPGKTHILGGFNANFILTDVFMVLLGCFKTKSTINFSKTIPNFKNTCNNIDLILFFGSCVNATGSAHIVLCTKGKHQVNMEISV